MVHHLAKRGSLLMNKPARKETVPRKKEKNRASAFQKMKNWFSEFI
jgi:hypothetical protein